MEWQEFTHTVHAPANAATLEFRLTVSGATGQTVWFDGIRLKVLGLVYFDARFCDPETSRFTTQDLYTFRPNDGRILIGVASLKALSYGFF